VTGTEASVTEQVADWIVKADYDDIPPIAIERLRDVVLDSLGNQFAGMSVSTGRILSDWVRAQGGTPISTVTGAGFKTTPSLATLQKTLASYSTSPRCSSASATIARDGLL